MKQNSAEKKGLESIKMQIQVGQMTNLKLLLGVVCEYSSQKDPEGL